MHLCVYEYNTTTLTIGIENGNSETVDLSSLEDGVGITSAQASAITANTAKTGITSSQASAITANTAKVGMTLGTTSSTALAGDALSGDVQIGNSSTDKIGFFGSAPTAQSDVNGPTWSASDCGYQTVGCTQDIEDNRAAINEIINALRAMGLIKTYSDEPF